jgi:hypothetical protein
VLRNRATNLSANTAVAGSGEPDNLRGELGLDPRRDANFVRLVHVYLFG